MLSLKDQKVLAISAHIDDVDWGPERRFIVSFARMRCTTWGYRSRRW